MNKILLKKEFIGGGEVSGFKFTQIHASVSAYLYKIDIDEDNVHFEVFKRKLTPLCIDFEKKVFSDTDFKEIYPKAKHFGDWAWTFKKLEDAERKFNEISK